LQAGVSAAFTRSAARPLEQRGVAAAVLPGRRVNPVYSP
jgi:hypothetical protein